jgi:eukaryotic-like serine/threonine-protein kinase
MAFCRRNGGTAGSGDTGHGSHPHRHGSAEVRTVLDHLVQGRLLSVGHGDQDASSRGGVVEIVHESLIDGWQTLKRWRAESAEDQAFLPQLGTAARQWDSKGRPGGLLWRGETMEEA